MPWTAQPKAVPLQLLFSSIDPRIGDPAHNLFQNPRAAPSPPTRQEPQQAEQIQRNDGMELSTGYNLTSADEVHNHKITTRHKRSSRILPYSKEGSDSVDLLKLVATGVEKKKSLGRIASFFGLAKKKNGVSGDDFDSHQAPMLNQEEARPPEHTASDRNRSGTTRTPSKTTISRAMTPGHPAKPLPSVPLEPRNSLAESSQETRFRRFVYNPTQSRKTAIENEKGEPGDAEAAETTKLDNRRTRFTTGLRNSVLGLLVQVRDGKSNRSETLTGKTDEKDTRQKQNQKRQIRSIGVSHEMLRNRDPSFTPPRKRNKSLTELNIGNPVLVIPPSYKTLLPLEVAQNDPAIRHRGQATFYMTAPEPKERRGLARSRASELPTLASNNNKVAGDEVCEPWLVEALGSLDEEDASTRDLRGRSQGREKATTPSQEIIRQTKASWTGQTQVNNTPVGNSLLKDHHIESQPLITRSQTVQRTVRKENRAPRLSLWSDNYLSDDASKPSIKYKSVRNGYPRRQTQTFHEVPTSRYSGSKFSEMQTHRSSRRLQAITGVPCESEYQRKQRKVKEYCNIHERNNEGSRYQRIPTRTSSMLPLHDRRESSVYFMSGGPTTPPPSSPLPAIPTSDSLTSCRSSTTKASLLYTPVSPIPTLSTSASTWSWRLNTDSPGSQLLNKMKTATDVVGKTHKPNMIPTKRHVQQQSITSSLSSAGLLDDVPRQSRQMKSPPVRASRYGQQSTVDGSKATPLHCYNSDIRPTSKAALTTTFASARLPESSQEATTSKTQQEGSQSSKSTASDSAGSPSSIVNLYMSRSQQTIAATD
ncbi:hypothetical protein QFC21_002369 [Naganishia friedmannii]|uniref:Uncharacterized protein n=1 Tax=Naganishia friedmannii TaxID=89922 RepID=A0ACC2VYL9_9TREE|nr:hypothetical protein QFC21_002369 [Naganishia friedmannii]